MLRDARVDALPQDVTGLPGRIGIATLVGASLRRAIVRLREVHCTGLLVSLTEPTEPDDVPLVDLSACARDAALPLRHCPIERRIDRVQPDAVAHAVALVLEEAQRGTHVALYSGREPARGGVLLAACLLALGKSTAAAVALARATRPGCIATHEDERLVQRMHAHYDAFPAAARKAVHGEPTHARIAGCLFGGALGDAMGFQIESGRLDGSRMIDLRRDFAPGDAPLSDDTQLTMFSVEAVIRARQARAGSCVAAFARGAYQRWYATQTREIPAIVQAAGVAREKRIVPRSPGHTCLRSLARGKLDAPNNSKGTGALVRAAPFGLAATSCREAFQNARDAGRITHGHPSGYLAAAYLGAVVFEISRGRSIKLAMHAAGEICAEEAGSEEILAAATGAAHAAHTPGNVADEVLCSALGTALSHDARSESVATRLWNAARCSRDPAAVASVAGSLIGVAHGHAHLPAEWVEPLEMNEVLAQLAHDLYASAALGSMLDTEAYPPVVGEIPTLLH